MTASNLFELLLLWIHLVAMVGALGGMLMIHRTLDAVAPEAASESGTKGLRLFNALLGLGFLAGFALYYIRVTAAAQADFDLGARFHIVVGLKFVLLLATGAFAAIASKRARSGRFEQTGAVRKGAICALALAALLGLISRVF